MDARMTRTRFQYEVTRDEVIGDQLKWMASRAGRTLALWLAAPLLQQQPSAAALQAAEALAAAGVLAALADYIHMPLISSPDIGAMQVTRRIGVGEGKPEEMYSAAESLVKAAALAAEAEAPTLKLVQEAAAGAAAVVTFGCSELLTWGAKGWTRSPASVHVSRACAALQGLCRHERSSAAAGAMAAGRVPQQLV